MKTIICKSNSKHLYGKLEKYSAIELPLWATIMANVYHADYIVDAEALGLDLLATKKKILSYNPDRIVILATGNHPSSMIQSKDKALELAKLLEEDKGLIVEVHDKLNFNPIISGRPRYDLLDMKKYRAHVWQCFGQIDRNNYGVVYTSISCPMHCDFCTIHSFYQSEYKTRPLKDIIGDFAYLGSIGVSNIKIMDELFLMPNKRVKDILEGIIELEYKFNIWCYARIDTVNEEILRLSKKAGINWISYGIESGSDRIRKETMKGSFDKAKIKEVVELTKILGINVLGNFMFGFYEDDMKTMEETYNFACELNCEFVNFYCLTAYPNTKFYDDMVKLGYDLPKTSEEYAQTSNKFKPLPTKYLNAKEVLNFRDKCFNEYFNRFEYVKMIYSKFGRPTVDEITSMLSINMER